MDKCVNHAVNVGECPCSKMECERRGICCECIRSHRSRGSLVACMRPDVLVKAE